MKKFRHATTLAIVLAFPLAATTATAPATAQKWLKKAAERALERETGRQIDRAVSGAVRCAVGEYECRERARREGRQVVLVHEDGNVAESSQRKPVTPSAPAVSAQYDFKAGDRVIFYDDYGGDVVGDFPRRFELVKGNWDVVEVGGGRMLRNTGPRHSAVRVPLPETLPQRFTIEMPVRLNSGNANLALALVDPDENSPSTRVWGLDFNHFDVGSWGTGVTSFDESDPTAKEEVQFTGATVTVRIMADGSHVKMYIDDNRVANVPNADLRRGTQLWIENTYSASDSNPMLVGPIRVAAGGRDLYQALEADGRVAVHDILFDTDAATIRPESADVLAEIAGMLDAHPNLSLMVEGHTDDTGGFDHNMALSKSRADAVKQWLVDRHAIVPERLRTLGLGPTQARDTNATEAGRQQNRRVELVRIG